MKTKKKHNFKHNDPEKIIKNPVGKITKKESTPATEGSSELVLIKKDLMKTIFMILGFFMLIAIFYVIQIKTDWLKPVLKIFGL